MYGNKSALCEDVVKMGVSGLNGPEELGMDGDF